ncbi:MAG: DUF503 domain-containing protein [Candidatus Schekmanbacteria bacterium]|nr:DUF503 domain-containing protein [Candidatus Schekmanbacteria bacterium]
MIVGTLTVDLLVHESQSLKDKRRVVKSLKDRLKSRFNVSVAEIGDLDDRQRACIGLATISNDKRVVERTLSLALQFVEQSYLAEITDHVVEIL